MLKRLKSPVLRTSVGTLVAGLMIASLLVVSAGIVAAQTSTTEINACYHNKSGDMRYLVSGQCSSKETAVSWNQAGPAGPKGDTGADGRNGTNGATTVRTVSVQSGTVIPGSSISHVVARCASNEKATGGGYNTTTNTPADIAVFQNRPEPPLGIILGPGWAAGFKNNDTTDKAITVYVICASP